MKCAYRLCDNDLTPAEIEDQVEYCSDTCLDAADDDRNQQDFESPCSQYLPEHETDV
jgi:hypothetical protein